MKLGRGILQPPATARLRSDSNLVSIGVERIKQMTALYQNWPTAFADRVGILPHQALTVYRLKGPAGSASLVAATNRWDVRVINEIWTGRFYDLHLPERIRHKSRPSVIDIGANRGFFTVYAATTLHQPHLLAFEPDPENLRILRANLALNEVESATVLEAAVVANFDSEADFFTANLPGLHTTVRPENAEEFNISRSRYSGVQSRVAAMHIDDALRAGCGEDGRIDFLKLDIEGLELALLEVVDLDLLRRTDYVVAETEYRHSDEAVRRLREAGLRVEELPWLLFAVRD